jgi:hypothetical protein
MENQIGQQMGAAAEVSIVWANRHFISEATDSLILELLDEALLMWSHSEQVVYTTTEEFAESKERREMFGRMVRHLVEERRRG